MLSFLNNYLPIISFLTICLIISNLNINKKIPKFLIYIFLGLAFAIFNSKQTLILKNLYSYFSTLAVATIIWTAGTNIKTKEYKNNWKIGTLLGFIPATVEIFAITFIAKLIFSWTWTSSILLAFIISAVSPAVVIPFMNDLKINKPKTQVSTVSLLSATLDDVYALIGFSIILSFARNGDITSSAILLSISSIFISIFLGWIIAKIISPLFIWPRTMFIISIFITMILKNNYIQPIVIALTISGIVANSRNNIIGNKDLEVFKTKVWQYFQIPLFFTIGTFLSNINFTHIKYIFIILCVGLIFRILFTYLIIRKSNFEKEEKTLLLVSQIPKATVQASIGGTVLFYNLPFGKEIASLAVLSILITAPLGGILMQNVSQKIKN